MPPERTERYQNYDQFYQQRNAANPGRLRRQQRDYAKKFGPLLTGDRQRTVLDIGCADGALVAFLKVQGFTTVTGIDLSCQLIEQARSRTDAEFIAGDAQQFLAGPRRFDIIFMLNVIEHIERDQLPAFMTAVQNALNPNGFVIVRAPNLSNIMAAGHLADDLTHHTGLTEQSLAQLAQRAGFQETEMLNQFLMQNAKGKLKALLNWPLHRYLHWLRGGTKPKVYYRNLYARLVK